MSTAKILCTAALTAVLCTMSTLTKADNHTKALISQYDVSWTTQSSGPDASMPCGGGELGLNVWVENSEVMIYFSDGAWLDENNALLKGGRLRLRLCPDPFGGRDFRQTLRLWDGHMEISGGDVTMTIWADVKKPVFHIDINSAHPTAIKASYESWRYEDRPIGDEKNATSWKWALPNDAKFTSDIFECDESSLTFRHENGPVTIFDYTVEKEGLGAYKADMYNPIGNLVWGGTVNFGGMRFSGTSFGEYIDTPFKAWNYEGGGATRYSIVFCGAAVQGNSPSGEDAAGLWRESLKKTKDSVFDHADRAVALDWWHSYWSRSYIVTDSVHPGSEIWKIGRNYQLFRYILGCNARGYWPTKFNGGLFTFDSRFVQTPSPQHYSPDYRNWCGGTMTAQNQRLVYFPMLKSGDWDMMRPQFEFYRRTLGNAELRSHVYWGHSGACFTEQLENYGLPNPAEYGTNRPEGMDPGMQDNRWLEYQWDTVLEFCLMILETDRYCGADIAEYLPMIESCLDFFEQHYRYLARSRGEGELDAQGKLVIYPGSGCETYKIARNPSSTIAALQRVSESLSAYYLKKGLPDKAVRWQRFRSIIPEIPYREANGRKYISPAEEWERVQNVETPQLYPVFPWRVIRPGDERHEYAVNTWWNDPDALKFRSHTGWKQDAVWAACMGLTNEAERLILLKYADGPHRFPAFWGPGFDWTPDHNWGGSAAIALQEMILGEDAQGNVTTLASWPSDWPVEYRLHGHDGRVHTNTPSGTTSVAGFFPLEGSGRIVLSFNPGWKYFKGEAEGAHEPSFDDSAWESVNLPHTVELLPSEGSGNRNYQGPAWYRKTFTVPSEFGDRHAVLHFEAVMGKQSVWVNGQKVQDNLGGYLPFEVDLTACGVKPGQNCTVALLADNSDDRSYPPGKTQYTLDFTYHGGIYRDVWLLGIPRVHVTRASTAGKIAGGGVFIHYDAVSREKASMTVDTDLGNFGEKTRRISLRTRILSPDGTPVSEKTDRVSVPVGGKSIRQTFTLDRPRLWSPEDPALYSVETQLFDGDKAMDGGITRTGVRSVRFDKDRGLVLNGEPYGQVIGVNRHQDFAYVGNAVPNNVQWADARRLRDAGFKIIRTAHYPQDPSFMDACDELGLFVIVATPGWQFWNNDPEFASRVHDNTRRIIRRDRNHPSVILWEPILNETMFPLDFSLEALRLTREEYPYAGAPGAAADLNSEGVRESYDVAYGWPEDKGTVDKPLFTREFGEMVDDWYAHNAINRAARHWGEIPMLMASSSLHSTLGQVMEPGGHYFGGAQWHPFDHQRGYHPDPYWGGDWDAFRQEKYAYEMFRSALTKTEEPFIFFANEMGQFSPDDVTIYSNCDSVRVWGLDGKPVSVASDNGTFVFPGLWNFWEARAESYSRRNWKGVCLFAEGFRDGRVVCTSSKMPSRRSTRLRLRLDPVYGPLPADGSSFVVVIAEVTDDNGNVRRLAKEDILFTVEGEGEIIGDASIGANPRAVEFGSAPVLIRSTATPGRIRVNARVLHEGTHAPSPASLEFYSVEQPFESLGDASRSARVVGTDGRSTSGVHLSSEESSRLLQEVERQQAEFGIR